jgi:hypothetical protein
MERSFNGSWERMSVESSDVESLAAPDTAPDAVDLLGEMVGALDGVAQTVREAAIAFHWLDRVNASLTNGGDTRDCNIGEEVPSD